MTFQALNTAISGLRAAQQQLSTISNNVSNATTEGYNRQILPQRTQVLRETGTTVGVLTQPVVRQVDINLQRDLWTQVSAASLQDVKIEYLQQIQTFNGPPDSGFSIAAELSDLRDSFSALSDIPNDISAQETTLNQARITADKFNDYAELITRLRNDSQNDLQTAVNRVNGLLEEITNINVNIRGAEHIGNTVAGLQDQRDIAIRSLTEELDISFFERADGVLIVQTREGQELAGDIAHRLEFDAVPISANQFYPETASALVLVNETNSGRITRTDLTERVIGGNLGGLVELRDEVLPTYQAQIDELAFQVAYRFQQQGLELFTNQNGFIPENTPPDPDNLPLPTAVPYVDFARVIQVNKDFETDPSILQRGTYNADAELPTGDNSVIRRIIEFAFGDVEFQQAEGTVDLTDGGANTDLQTLLGLQPRNNVVLGTDFTSFPQIFDGVDGTNDLIETFQDEFIDFPDNDQFRITFGTSEVIVDLEAASTNFPIGGAINNAADQLLGEINAQIAAAGLTSDEASATLNNFGQIVLSGNQDITIDRDPTSPSLPEALSQPAIEALGIQTGTFAAENPNFTIQIGNGATHTIDIEPGDTVTELIDKLTYNPTTQTGIPGLFVEQNADGGLTIRPGIDDDNFDPLITEPLYGGDITITSGSFTVTGATAAGVEDGVSVVGALFGSFTGTGATLVERSPVTNVAYQFETQDGSDEFVNFRNDNLGPNAAISTGIFSSTSLIDFAQKIIDETAQDFQQAQNAFENEDTLRGILQRQFSDESGVNIDEELSHLIVVQTAYAASARTITAADEMFQELLNSIR